ncbi:MAG: hypothetical protein P1P84_09810 [Deferrisomatales bacterium]|nr:hypothetical protein [Deferrisomatales bacterium]
MQHTDEWGRNPEVRRMRLAFAAMEEAQRELVQRAGLSMFDPRLRNWRERALTRFESAWARELHAGRQGGVGAVYARCLADVLAADGVRHQGLASPAGAQPR